LSRLSLVVVASLFLGSGAARAENGPGVTDTEIKIGQTAPYSGPASSYGTIGKVMAAYFRMINDQGGINGRKINLISVDDAYSPAKTVEQVRRLVEGDNVLLVNTIGTATSAAVLRYLNTNKVPDLFISSGSSKWSDNNSPWSIGISVTYRTEGIAYARYVLKEKPDAKIAILYQNDDFGRDVLGGFKAGLGDRAKDMIVAERSYDVSDPTINSQVVTLRASGADTLLDLSTPRFASIMIRTLYEIGWKPLHILASASSSIGGALAPAGLDKAVGIISSASTKDPVDPEWKDDAGMNEWRAFMKKYYPEGNLQDGINVGSYHNAQAIVHVLKMAGNDLSRENIMRQAANLKDVELPCLLPGIRLNTTPEDRYPVKQLRLKKFDGKQWVLIGDLFGE
jgi:branched-chain amino acid transport system substrate-binding protein